MYITLFQNTTSIPYTLIELNIIHDDSEVFVGLIHAFEYFFESIGLIYRTDLESAGLVYREIVNINPAKDFFPSEIYEETNPSVCSGTLKNYFRMTSLTSDIKCKAQCLTGLAYLTTCPIFQYTFVEHEKFYEFLNQLVQNIISYNLATLDENNHTICRCTLAILTNIIQNNTSKVKEAIHNIYIDETYASGVSLNEFVEKIKQIKDHANSIPQIVRECRIVLAFIE